MTQGTVFIAYNPADEAEKEDLVTHLGVLQRQGLIETWTDDQSTPGVDKASEMEEAINRAKVTILLITPNFLSSDFVSGEEMKRILERRQTQAMILYPIIARPCAWKRVPWLARLRVRPRNEKPAWREGGRYVDEELAAIAEEIAEIMEKAGPQEHVQGQPSKGGTNIGGGNFSDISNSQISVGDISTEVSAGGDIVGRDKVIHYHYYGEKQELAQDQTSNRGEGEPVESRGLFYGGSAIRREEAGPNQAQVDVRETEKEIFISYAWGGESEEIVNKLDAAFQARGVKIIRDKRDLGYKGRIKAFMERIGRGKCIIVVVSEKYLKSENCMFELVQIAKNGQFYDRIFPIVLADANIYKSVNRIKYIKYWEEQIQELDAAMKSVGAANLQGLREDIDSYTEIRRTIAELTNILKDMNTLTSEIHSETDFETLFQAIEQKMAE